LFVGGLYVGWGIRRRVPPADAAALTLMGVGMAAMFVPALDVLPGGLWAAAFGVSGCWFAAEALRAGTLFGSAGHHVVCASAMLFMLLGGNDRDPSSAGEAAEAGHAHHAAATSGGAFLVTVAALALAAWFAADAIRPLSGPAPDQLPAGKADVAVAARPTRRSAVLEAHRFMSAAMVVMLISMV
jgi:hypothetical protein